MDIMGDGSWFSRFGKALSIRRRELILMRLNFLATYLRNLDLPDTLILDFYSTVTSVNVYRGIIEPRAKASGIPSRG